MIERLDIPPEGRPPSGGAAADARDMLLAMTARRHLLAGAEVALAADAGAEGDMSILVREARTQTHLLWSIAKFLDEQQRRADLETGQPRGRFIAPPI